MPHSSEPPPRTYSIVSSTGFCCLVTFAAGVLLASSFSDEGFKPRATRVVRGRALAHERGLSRNTEAEASVMAACRPSRKVFVDLVGARQQVGS